MAHVGTQDLLSADALVDARGETGRAKAKPQQQVADFYDMRPGETIEPTASRQAGQMRDEWRRKRYARLKD